LSAIWSDSLGQILFFDLRKPHKI